MLFTETLFISVELLIYLSSFSFFVLDIFEFRLLVVFFFLSQMAFYILLMFAGMVQSLFGSGKGVGRHRSTGYFPVH